MNKILQYMIYSHTLHDTSQSYVFYIKKYVSDSLSIVTLINSSHI